LDEILGLLALAAYIVAIIGLAAAITYTVIRIFPTERNPKKPDKPDDSDQTRGTESSGGSLFRRSKKAAT
jgi:hypothetical protein